MSDGNWKAKCPKCGKDMRWEGSINDKPDACKSCDKKVVKPTIQEPWESALELCDEVIGMLKELPEWREEFADSATETVSSIRDWIEEHAHVTDKQLTALQNIKAAADRD